MSSSLNSCIPNVYLEALPRNRLPSITPSTFSIDESSVEYIDSDKEFASSYLTSNIYHQTWKIEEQTEVTNNEDQKYNDKKQHENVLKGFKKMFDKFVFVNVPTTEINQANCNIDEKSAYIIWLGGL
uniref:Uncharacterized protein n=1 Tax=Panagrolaimus sp. PS1159 TaxID=55785 RepID=A0AC35GUW0_9BILA